ncbi:hypothetical protein F5888DRAFT_72285 [Russula emetica]|nr:hypothetical protein F5888DRAFT_72285 [Russula emetica]KAI0287022.1 hypothetical protein BGY98DRAFT_26292 [Russula aff. rugulosa BPL654]
MPAITQDYEVLLVITNDSHDCATVQLLRDYGRNTGAIVLLQPTEAVTLVLEAGSTYKYVIKTQSKLVSVSVRTWRDVQCTVSQLFSSTVTTSQPISLVNGITVDRIWRDYRFNLWTEA